MAVLLIGVGADSQNVRPRPRLELERRFEYVPIPEKSIETTEQRSFGSVERRYGDGYLSDFIDGIKPNGDADWIDEHSEIRGWPVHYDPNLKALTYGEGGKDQNVNAIEDHLSEGDIIGFYTGLDTHGKMHRYLFAYFTVDEEPRIITKDTSEETKRDILSKNEENAHAKRFAANDELYAFDSSKPEGANRVAIVPGREPSGLLDRAVQLSGRLDSGQFYMSEEMEDSLEPHTTHLGGFKNPIRCDIPASEFVELVKSRQ